MKQSNHKTIALITQKVTEIKSCLANNDSIKNNKSIELLLDSILAGIMEESATKLRLVK